MTETSDDVSAVYLDTVTLSCTVFGSIVIVTWSTTANVSLPEAMTISTGENEVNSSLTLADIHLEAMGVYTCSAENPFGSDFGTVLVNVTGL